MSWTSSESWRLLTVYDLFHQHDETKNILLPVSLFKETGSKHRKFNRLSLFFAKKSERFRYQKTHYSYFLSFFCCASSSNWVSSGKKEPELTPKKFGHNINSNFQ